ncbi:MAG: preprotein translocase subunit SecA [Christensenellales bacterium]|jgi:preprotein translocase subunit SecA
MGIFKTLFSSENERTIKKLKKIADKVDGLAEKYKAMSDSELTACTDAFKRQLSEGATLDDLLCDAYALVREASTRVLGLRHFYVQIIGGIVLHQARIAEMKTGEGKTLVATLPAYLNALSGKGVHIVTVNDYLARRDAEWMGKIHRFLGLTVGVIAPGMKQEEKREAYKADITYCTNNELGFDYLRDNMCVRREDKVLRKLNYAIIDEVDSILIDEARTPLIISGAGTKSSEIYITANRFARSLGESDFIIEEKERTVRLTEEGVVKAEKFFNVENLSDIENTELNHHINIALKANYLMKKDKDYIVNDGEVIIVDEFTGRLMLGRRYSEGLHQAIEAKERVRIQSENKTLATITFQNFFRLYDKLAGMTGTAKTEESEFMGIYGMDVVVIPTNLPMIRIDENDQLYKTEAGKFRAVVKEIEEKHKSGQPLLIGTITVEKSEELSKKLKALRIPHNVLNAKNHAKEAEIVAQAGKKGAVTIATNMAGRGTDIMLGGNPEFMAKAKLINLGYPTDIINLAMSYIPTEDAEVLKAREEFKKYYDLFAKDVEEEKQEIIKLGGLRIIGTERHDSRRIDNQLRGRAGRQGDPGSSIFYISMEDEVARVFGGERLKAICNALNLDEDTPIANKIITRQIERAQLMVESRNYSIRKHVLSYDDVLNKQREIIYKEREKVLTGEDVHEEILKMIPDLAQEIIEEYADYSEDYHTWDYKAFNDALEARLLPKGANLMNPKVTSCFDVYKLLDITVTRAREEYEKKIASAKEIDIDFGDIERVILLRTVDKHWIEHIDQMDVLRKGIGLRAYGQRDPVIAYQNEGFDMFDAMIKRIRLETVMLLMKANVERTEPRPSDNLRKAIKEGSGKSAPVKKKTETGRNDLCPCGSGKKYKNCCIDKD